MDKDDKVISLAERLGRKEGQTDKQAKKQPREAGEPLPGKLTWLHCPACGTMEYTEAYMPGGRRHNVCGAPVEEVVLDVDVRAEFTIAALNLERLKAIEEAVGTQRARYEEYQERLRLMAGAEPVAYPLTADTVARLPVAAAHPLGLLIPEALHEPARRFAGDEAPEGQGESPEPDPAPPKP
jgi:hypothetical protein